ncbi:MAG TPA: YihY/virulence factor BrkB family protein [Chloroflexota bacterium]
MNIPGQSVIEKVRNEAQDTAEDAQRQANRVDVPLTRRLGLADFVKQLFHEIGQDHVGAFAGNLAYNALFAMFPFAIFLLSLLGLFHATHLVNTMIDRISPSLPPDAIRLIRADILSVAETRATGAVGVGAVIALLLALWGVSGAFRAVMEALNVAYSVRDSRPLWKRYAISLLLSASAAVLFIAAIVLAIFGPAIGHAVANAVGLGSVFTTVWNLVQWPVLLLFVLAAFALIYYFAPDAEQNFRFISPGSIAAVLIFGIFSGLFQLYVSHFGAYNKVYGTLAGLVILLLYLYYSGFILLVGAEINKIIEHHAPGGKRDGQRAPSGRRSSKSEPASHTLEILKENRPV